MNEFESQDEDEQSGNLLAQSLATTLAAQAVKEGEKSITLEEAISTLKQVNENIRSHKEDEKEAKPPNN